MDVTDEDAFIMSLAENIARRGYRPLEILADIEILRKRGYSAEIIIQKTGLSPKYVKDIVFLLDQGEERKVSMALKTKWLPPPIDSAIDKLFCSNFERTAELRYSLASNQSCYSSA